jgi:hypothetical protein
MVELSPIGEDERSEVNSMITNLRESISNGLDYFSKIEEASAFAAPVSPVPLFAVQADPASSSPPVTRPV